MKRRLLLVVLLLSLSFNIISVMVIQMNAQASSRWPFPEVGPGIMQDSYHDQAPVLESPFGMIGDIPGGYSLYTGSPLQAYSDQNVSTWIETHMPWAIPAITPNIHVVLFAALFAILPLVIVAAVGRRSYGTAKTR